LLEAAAGIEPAYKGFAGLGLPTWLRRLKTLSRQKAKPAVRSESDSGFQQEAHFRTTSHSLKSGSALIAPRQGQGQGRQHLPLAV
jgi:hypothetical protein